MSEMHIPSKEEFIAAARRRGIEIEIHRLEDEVATITQSIADKRNEYVKDILNIQLERQTARLRQARLALLDV